MYSRYHKSTDNAIRLPEDYGGVAFSERALTKNDVEHPARTLEVAKPSPPLGGPLPPPPPPPKEPPEESESEAPPPPKSSASPHQAPLGALLPVGVTESFPFAHGIGFEELFIIALIILLAKNDQGSDVVLWLTLLLFCG